MENIKFVAHLTSEYQLKAADKLISTLKQKLAANEEYIKEIEEQLEETEKRVRNEVENTLLKTIHSLEKELEKEKAARQKLCQKYSDDVCQFIKTDALYAKYKDERAELRDENKRLKKQKEDLICKVIQLEKNV